MTRSLWRLDADHATLLLQANGADDVPAIVWFGALLPPIVDDDALAAITDQALPMAKLDTTVPLSLFPQSSSGIDCEPALRGHRHGQVFSHQLMCTAVSVSGQMISIELADDAAELGVIIELTLEKKTGVLSIGSSLENRSADPFTVDWLASATMPLPDAYSECLYLHGRWGLEFQQQRVEINNGSRITLRSHRGRTSHECYPGVMLGQAGFNECSGDVTAATLAWSGSHTATIDLLSDGRRYYQSGISLDPGELQLQSGESFTAPHCYFKRDGSKGLNGVSQQLHSYLRSQLLPAWTRTARPVHANSWEALYFDHNIDTLKALIDSAADVGAERFILDDGWFPARRSDTAGLGDWVVDKVIYPDGLHPVVEHIRSKSLQFGLWFEPEMVNPDSDLYRDHPDWVLHCAPYDTPLARNQLVLDIDKSEVFEYLYQKMADLVREYKIDYIKWDHNRDLVMAGDGERSRMHRQTMACYRLMKKLTDEFSHLEIESCSSGGARADWGVLQFTGRVWTSDSIDAVDRVAIQRGYSYFNPPEIMGAHVGHAEAHLTGRKVNLHTRAVVAMQGQYGYEIDARKLDAESKQLLEYYVALYKKHRKWIANSTSWRLDSIIENLVCSGLVSDDQKHSLWFAIAVSSLPTTLAGSIIMQGLSAEKQYRVEFASKNYDQLEHFSKHMPDWLQAGVVVSGALLMTVGLSLPVMPAQSALLIEAQAQ